MRDKTIRVLLVQKYNRDYRASFLTKLSKIPGLELTMVCGTRAPHDPMEVGINIFDGNLPFRVICAPIKGLKVGRKELLWFQKSLEMVINEKFDIVITDYYSRVLTTLPLMFFQKRGGGKTILWGIGFGQNPNPLLDALRAFIAKKADALLLYSDKGKEEYVKNGIDKRKCFVTQNTVDIESINSSIGKLNPEKLNNVRRRIELEGGPLLIHVGRLSVPKRLDLFIRAAKRLREKWSGLRVVLIGDGPERPALERLVSELSLGDVVHFPGAITDYDELAPWMNLADLVVAPAQIGLLGPMALAYGKPLLISDQPEHLYPELQVFSDGKTGLKYDFHNKDSLAEVLEKMIDNKDLLKTYGEFGYKRVREMMGQDIMVEEFVSAINYVVT